MSNISVPATGAPAWWGGVPPNYPVGGFTGKNVIVGIVDSGIDFTHPDFLIPGFPAWNSNPAVHKTRLLSVWDQTDSRGPSPVGFIYGTEFMTAGIDSGLSYAYDSYIHGTSITGIAAGNGQGTGNGRPAYTYVGMAPEADIIVVKMPVVSTGGFQAVKQADGVRYIFARAVALGKPCVVLLGPSADAEFDGSPGDGTSLADTEISNQAGAGKIIVCAAGDMGGSGRHAELTTTTSGQSGIVSFSVSGGPSTSDVINVEGWYNAGVNYTATLIYPNGTDSIGPVTRGNSASGVGPGTATLSNGVTATGGSYRVAILLTGFTGNAIPTGEWQLQLTANTAGTNRCDFWIGFNRYSTQPVFVSGMTNTRLVASPATGTNVIAVGSYCTRASWLSLSGQTYSTGGTVGAIAANSSPGPRRDGVQVPHLVAPGLGIASTRSVGDHPAAAYYMPDDVHRMLTGTSHNAAAHVAGAVALLLQQYPTIEPVDMRVLLAHHSKSDVNTGTVPNATWGNGKLSLRPRCS